MQLVLPTKARPKMDRWLRDRGLGAKELSKRWGISRQAASRYLLPFDHERRVIPREHQIADALSWTAGEIAAGDWYPPHLNGQATQPEEAMA